MSIYSTGAEAYRDTAKWLVTFVPVATLVSAAAVLGPRLLEDAASAGGVAAWLRDSAMVLLGVLAVASGIGLIVWYGGRLLSTQPSDFAGLLGDATRLSQAFNAGVGAPYFLDDVTYQQALGDLAAHWSAGTEVNEVALSRANAATETLRAWALQREMTTRFQRFVVAFTGGVALVLAGFLVTAAALGPVPLAITEPTAVTVAGDEDAVSELRAGTGCRNAASTDFLAVGGTWQMPLLTVDGPGCRFGATWEPSAGVEVRPAG